MEPSQSRIVDTREMADILKIHTHTLTMWAMDGRVPSLQSGKGGHRRYDVEKVLTSIDSERDDG